MARKELPMISQAMQDAINNQIQAEMYSSHLYLSMSAYCDSINLKGMAHWLRLQSQEETGHALKFFDYLNARDGRILLQQIPQPVREFKGPRDVFDQTLEHERKVTGLINKLYDLASTEHDYATLQLLQWFIAEQVEEEASASEVVEKLKMIGESSNAIYMLDRELGKRGKSED
jgi:ferritin